MLVLVTHRHLVIGLILLVDHDFRVLSCLNETLVVVVHIVEGKILKTALMVHFVLA